jgi:hypothetical protein
MNTNQPLTFHQRVKIVMDAYKKNLIQDGFPISPPQSGDDKNTYISRCISEEIGKGHEQSQAVAMCIANWENK